MALIAGVQYSGVSPGTVMSFSGTTAPPRTLLCNGDTIPNGVGTVQGITADFSTLFSIIGSTYGGSGKLPDTRGIFLRGNGTQVIGPTTYTGTLGTRENDAYPAHNHGGGDHAHGLGTNNAGNIYDSGSLRSAVAWFGGGSNTTFGSGTIIGTNGTGTETKPANLTVNYCIAF